MQKQESKKRQQLQKERRVALRQCRDAVNKQFAKTAPTTVLAEDESLCSYQRKRLFQSFEKPPSAKKQKSHSPNFDNVVWDKNQVILDLQAYQKENIINWSKFAREHGVLGANAGQIVKEFAQANGIDTEKLDHRTPQRRLRSQHKRLPGGEIAIPCNPTPKSVKKTWSEMIETGELSLGEPCTPYTLTKYTTHKGVVSSNQIQVHGRKFSLLYLRKKLLKAHEKFMRLVIDTELENFTQAELIEACKKIDNTVSSDHTPDQLRNLLAMSQRQRSPVIWHDHATVLNTGFIMVTVHILYDDSVFLTNDEYERKYREALDVQSEIEQLEVHMLVLGSSSIEDQAALLPERVACLHDLNEVIKASNGVPIIDRLQFFTGDKPAAQFERGTQIGGTYKCGGCGCKDILMDDQAHVLRCPLRDLKELQKIAVSGTFGKQPLTLKPYDQLRVADLKKELLARKVYEVDQQKPILTQILQDTLKGIQRVPSLLLLNPQQPLSHLYLDHYTVLDSEPLHDLKGHLLNLFLELPYILSDPVKEACESRIKLCTSKDKTTGADLRCCHIEVYLLIHTSVVNRNTVHLLESLIRVSEILYSSYEHRCPRTVLELYNNAWLHHELCRELFDPLHISRTKMYGNYLHALCSHAPQQYEIVCLKSVNTENQERFFGQARRTASLTSNRTPENIITNVLLRMQAKRTVGRLLNPVKQADSQVRRAAAGLSKFGSTVFSKTFVSKRSHSWQAHLERISPFIVLEKGVWWDETNESYKFFDGANDPNYKPEGPQLLHFRSSTLKSVTNRQNSCWQIILKESITIPTEQVHIYDIDGDPVHNTPPLVPDTTGDKEQPPLQLNNPEPPPHALHNTHSTPDSTEDTEQTSLQIEDQNETLIQILDPEASNSPEQETLEVPSHEHASLEDPTGTQRPPHLTSTLCRAITKVVGYAQEENLSKLDKLHTELKAFRQKKQKISGSYKRTYNELLASFRTLVLGKRVLLQNELASFERRFYNEHNRLPSISENSHSQELLSRRNYANKLLNSWNITW